MFRPAFRCNIFPVFRKLNRNEECHVSRTFIVGAKRSASIVYNDEVSYAKKNNIPIVALESTIITHGMPYPDNLETALRVENIIREQGAVPATIGILEGKICAGIDEDGLEKLAMAGQSGAVKCSRRDFPFVISKRLNGGTTVSGTMTVAHLAGIPIMATGGIGGVHRFAEKTYDVSADLVELGRTPIAVVCSGVKAILDIPKTLEFLETQGVPVVTVGKSDLFPAFYSRETIDKIRSPYTVENPEDVANLILAQRHMALTGGILLAVPIPQKYSLDASKIETAIQVALKDAETQKIFGKDVTPFLLQRLNEITAGQSLRSNRALIENNARLAGQIASQLCSAENLLKGMQPAEKSTKNGSVVVGGSILDTVVQVDEPTIKLDGRTHFGSCRESFGGVGRNVAAAMINLGLEDTELLSVVGADGPGKILRDSLKGGDGLVEVIEDVTTARYVALVDSAGDCKFGVGEMTAHKAISPALILKHKKRIENADLLVLDGNPPLETIGEVIRVTAAADVPVWYEPTDIRKATKIFEANDLWKSSLHFISPNQNELLAIAKYFGILSPMDHAPTDLKSLETIAEQVAAHVPIVLTTLGPRGLLVTRRATEREPFYDEKGKLIQNICSKPQTRLYSPIPLETEDRQKVASASGCGDCLVAGIIRGIRNKFNEVDCVTLGLKAASLSLISMDPVPSTLSNLA